MSINGIPVIIPSLDPDEKLMRTVEGLEAVGFNDILIVDDGSKPENARFFPDETEHPSCTVLHHRRNRGKGAALKTAFRYILNNRPDVTGVVTADGDGQHAPEDVLACAEMMQSECKVVLGCRNFGSKNVPARSRFGNRMTSFVLKLFCGIRLSDTQTGLRAIPRSYLARLKEVRGERFEYETNMLICFKQEGIPFVEQRIRTVYIEENKSSHFRPFADSVRIYRFIFAYCFSSLGSALVDEGVFYLLSLFVNFGGLTKLFNVAAARLVSSLFNFTINRTKVFSGRETVERSLAKYYALAIPQMLVSTLLLYVVTWLLGLTGLNLGAGLTTVIKAVIDTVLFFVSFRIQQQWVFNKSKEEKGKQMKKQTEKLTVGRIVRRTLLCIFTAIMAAVLTLFTLCFVLAHGPSVTIRNKLVLSAKQASATKWVPGLFLSKETVDKIVEDSKSVSTDVVDIGDIGNDITEDEWSKAKDGVLYYDINGPTYKAYLLIIKDPSRVSVGVSSDNFKSASAGARFYEIAEKYNALIALNSGEFEDIGGVGSGARPMGITYSGGKLVWNDGATNRTYIGFDKENRLIVREGMTVDEANRLGIRDMVAFQNNNVLIERDGESVKVHYKEGDNGTAQRTAIGQRDDGTVIMIVTDGRTASSLGATPSDVIGIMLEYGAVSAAMLDGGSSTLMYYRDYFNLYNLDTNLLDQYQKMGLVNKYKAFTTPRRIPTYFIVK